MIEETPREPDGIRFQTGWDATAAPTGLSIMLGGIEEMKRRIEAEHQAAESKPETALLVQLIESGWLVPVEVFGTDSCCEHGPHTDCESTSYGLCDRFTTLNVAGSDCNRAAFFLLRPSDEGMNDVVRAALTSILDRVESHDLRRDDP